MAGGLVLGPVVFQAFEVPERIRFGGKQRVAVHELFGGGRVVDAVGAEEGPIEWSGVFSGGAGAARVRMLEGLRRDGSILLLAWEGWRYSVVIEGFQAVSMNPAWIPYSLRMCVVSTGDLVLPEALPAAASLVDAVALGAGDRLDGRIVSAEAGLNSGDVVVAIAAAGTLARLVTARAMVDASDRSGK